MEELSTKLHDGHLQAALDTQRGHAQFVLAQLLKSKRRRVGDALSTVELVEELQPHKRVEDNGQVLSGL